MCKSNRFRESLSERTAPESLDAGRGEKGYRFPLPALPSRFHHSAPLALEGKLTKQKLSPRDRKMQNMSWSCSRHPVG
jgi:hypothetical protein